MISRSRRVLAVDLFLATVSAVLVVYIVRQILVPMPRVTPRPMIAAVRPAEPTRTSADGGRPQATSYSVTPILRTITGAMIERKLGAMVGSDLDAVDRQLRRSLAL